MTAKIIDFKILHLTLHRKWFDLIATGEKKIEYRNFSEHWNSRLIYDSSSWPPKFKNFNIVRFKNGYQKKSPVMDVEFLRIVCTKINYEIHLGNVIKIENWAGKK